MNASKMYMAVTADLYEMPLCITSKPKELAEAYGMKVTELMSYISRGNVRNKVRFVRVEIEADEN